MRQFIVYDQYSKGCPDSKQIKKIRSHTATQAHYQRRLSGSGARFSSRASGYDSAALKATVTKGHRARPPDNDDETTAAVSRPLDQTPLPEVGRHRAKSAEAGPCNCPDSAYDTLPLKLQPFEHKLVEYYVNVLAREYCGLPGADGREARFNPWRDTNFQIALQHPMLFRLIVLGIGAGHAKATRGAKFTKDVEYQQYKSLREMQMYFAGENDDCSDTRIAACLFRAMLETCLGTAGRPLIHMRAASSMVQKRGGCRMLQRNPLLMASLFNFSWRFAREGFDGPEWRTTLPQPASSICTNHCDTTNCYLEFLVDAEILSRKQKSTEYRRRLPLRHTVFTEIAYIAKMISAETTSAHPFQWADGDWLHVLIFVIYLNGALLDFEHDAATTELFLEDFRTRMKMMEVDGHKSVRSVVRMLVRPSEHEALNDRHWKRWYFAGRMLRWAVQLSRDYEERVIHHLYCNLTFQHEGGQVSKFVFKADGIKEDEDSV